MKKEFKNEFITIECEEKNGDLFITLLGVTKKIDTPAQMKNFLSIISNDLYLEIYDNYFNQFTRK